MSQEKEQSSFPPDLRCIVFMYIFVCLCGYYHQEIEHQLGVVANLPSGQLDRGNSFSQSPCTPYNFVSLRQFMLSHPV